MSDCKCCAPLDDLRKVLENIDTYDEDDDDGNENNESDTYKHLVLAGAKIVKDLKALKALKVMDDEVYYEVFEDGEHLSDALGYLTWVAADISTNEDSAQEIARIYYADMVSVYAYDEEIGEKYYDLFWKMNSGDEKATAELMALSKSIPADEHYWLRRNT